MRKNWWKFLAVALLLYSVFVGMLVPLKPGVYEVSPFKMEAGKTQTLDIIGYNTFYNNKPDEVRAWLKYDEQYALAAQSISVESDTKIKAVFDLPRHFPTQEEALSLTLYLDNPVDGAAVFPDAVSISNIYKGEQADLSSWTANPIDNLSFREGMTYPYRSMLGETIRNTFFHVPFWFAMLIIFTISMVYSWKYLKSLDSRYDHLSTAYNKVGVLLGLLGLATGSIWARFTWGDWWNFDIKQNMSAIAMLIYLAFFVLRSSFDDPERRAKISNVYSIFAFSTLIPLLFVIPRLADSLHPGNGGNPGFGGDDLDNTMRMVLYPAVIGWTLLCVWMANLLARMENLKEKVLFH